MDFFFFLHLRCDLIPVLLDSKPHTSVFAKNGVMRLGNYNSKLVLGDGDYAACFCSVHSTAWDMKVRICRICAVCFCNVHSTAWNMKVRICRICAVCFCSLHSAAKDMKVKICRICVTVACIDRLGFHPDEYRVGSPEIMLLARQQWAAQEWCPIPGPAKVSTDSPACPCGQEDQTTEHVLQRCPPSFYVAGYKATREDVWLVSTSLTTDQTLGLHAGAEKMTSFISWVVCWLFVGCLTSQQQASVSQGRICSDNFTCCHTWDRSCRSNVLPHPVTVYWHRADQSQCWPYNARRLAG